MIGKSADDFLRQHAHVEHSTLHDQTNQAELDRLNYLFGPPLPVTSAASEPTPIRSGSVPSAESDHESQCLLVSPQGPSAAISSAAS